MEKKINTGIVGFGLSGKVFHAPFLHTHKGFNLKTVVERHGNTSRSLYEYITLVRDYKELIADSAIDLVVICTPNVHHFEMAQACLEAGKHIVVEKPFMPTAGEAEEVIRLAGSNNLKIFVYQNRRWDGDFLTIGKLFESGLLGQIQYYEAHFDRFSPKRTRAAWRDEELPGSGVLYDLGSHLVDQAYALFGKPLSVKATLEAQREHSKVDDFFEVHLQYPGLKAVLTAGMLVENPELRYVINGSLGSYIKFGIDPQEALIRNGQMPEGETWGEEPPGNWGLTTFVKNDLFVDGTVETLPGNYMGFYDNVYDVLTHGADMAVKPEEARDVIRMIELAVKSSREKTEIKF